MEEKRLWKDYNIRTAKTVNNTHEDIGMKKSAQATSSAGISGGGTFFTRPLDYRPELASPDRWSYPKDIHQKNGIWRMFYELDPIAGTVIDLYAEMAMSDYDIVGAGVDGEIENDLEDMCEEIRLGQLVSMVMKEFLVTGEAVPHLFYDKDAGYWTDWSLHKPENIELLDTQLLGMDPILYLTASTEEVRELKKIMKLSESFNMDVPGRGFLKTLLSNKKVPLEPLNVTFIPRLLHPYDIRGVSMFSRLWRIWMYEDAIMNASIQTAKRHAGPIKTVSMGDLASGYIPSEQQEQQLLQALAQAEMDPHSWILVPPGTKFDAWGTVERTMSIRNEYDVIERMKLLALGTSKDLISGASTFASAQAGLQVFLSRLLAFRTFIEEVFINPKVFGVISRLRKWYVPTQAELSHKIRLNKDDRFVKPRLRWEKSLKTRVDKELLDAYSDLVERFHIKVSERSVSDAAGLDWSDEVRRSLQEDYLKKIIGEEELKELGVPGGLGSYDTSVQEVPTEEKSLEELAPEPKYLEEEVAPMHASSKRKVDKILTFLNKENAKISCDRDAFLCGTYSKKSQLPKEVMEEKLM